MLLTLTSATRTHWQLSVFLVDNGFGEAKTCRQFIYKKFYTVFKDFVLYLLAINEVYCVWVLGNVIY